MIVHMHQHQNGTAMETCVTMVIIMLLAECGLACCCALYVHVWYIHMRCSDASEEHVSAWKLHGHIAIVVIQ